MYYFVENEENKDLAKDDSVIDMVDEEEASKINVNLPDEEELEPETPTDEEGTEEAPTEEEEVPEDAEEPMDDPATEESFQYSSEATLNRIYESLSDIGHIKVVRRENVVKAVIPSKRSSVSVIYDKESGRYVIESRVGPNKFENTVSENAMIRYEDDLVRSIILGGN